MLKNIHFSFYMLVMTLCTFNHAYSEILQETYFLKSNSTDTIIEINRDVKIDLTKLESFTGINGLYSFNAPEGLYLTKNENEYFSEGLQSNIIFHFTETDQIDDPNSIWEKKDLANKMKRNLKVTYATEKNDWVVVSGFGKNGEIIYKKGFYFKPRDNHMGENGRNTQPWCFTGVLEIRYPAEHQAVFDKIIPIIIKSFKCDFLSQCANCF
jgi:hypothetical protein